MARRLGTCGHHLLLFLAYLCCLPLEATTLSFWYDFSTPGVVDRADLIYKNDSWGASDRVMLTKVTNGSVGRVAYAQPARLWDGRTGEVASFATSFSFAIDGNHNSNRGDGIAFFVGPFPPTVPPKSNAGYLGLYSNQNLSLSGSGSPSTVAVEFDTYWNQDLDPPGVTDHVGINVNSIHSANYTTDVPDLGIYAVSSDQKLPKAVTSATISLPVPLEFSYQELFEATDGFNEGTRLLGSGYFGEVYLGHLPHPGLPNPDVAVKKLKSHAEQLRKNYVSEITILGLLNHRNPVKLVGWCDGGDGKQLLVYELVKNGSVDDHLHGPAGRSSPLTWPQRYKIALGVGRAIEYLHTGCHNLIVLHRDIKPSNVMLDERFDAKLADFGLVRSVDPGQSSLGGTEMNGTRGAPPPTR
ncbi:hypothetical protein HU200_009397 [Digitaria exilis]|uniref:non-specific serine/threonine protein kinase n=1 Tax=Digitaria exilis TaxID=1010633 RepID=A0A835KSL3_9POAL|nr:hypothetical protein HU200_009397 [Digitaria exilis]